MRFWDSSALLSLFVEERLSPACRSLIRTDGDVVVWALTSVELTSAVQRRRRRDDLLPDEARAALDRLVRQRKRWTSIESVPQVTERAERLLANHDLRAADALQLAAALIFVEDRPRGFAFVCADDRLCRAADVEGFDLVVPTC